MDNQPRVLFLLTADPGDEFSTFMDNQVGVGCWNIQRRQYVDTKQTFYRVFVMEPTNESIKTIARIKFSLEEA
jgi:hypothetical protein